MDDQHQIGPRTNERSRALKEAIRHELRLLLDEADITCDTLGRIGQVCSYGESMIKAIEAPVGAATVTPIDLKRSLEQAQAAFACSPNDGQPILPEQTPGETVAVRLLKELITMFRPQLPQAAPPQALPQAAAQPALPATGTPS